MLFNTKSFEYLVTQSDWRQILILANQIASFLDRFHIFSFLMSYRRQKITWPLYLPVICACILSIFAWYHSIRLLEVVDQKPIDQEPESIDFHGNMALEMDVDALAAHKQALREIQLAVERLKAPQQVKEEPPIQKTKKPKQKKPKAKINYEPGFPRRSTVEDFATRAVEMEVQKHDRLIVEGMAYMKDLTEEKLKPFQGKPQQQATRKLCINISVCNRRIPYIDAAMMTLMTGQSPDRLNSYAQVNLLNTERRKEFVNFDRMKIDFPKIPFVNIYNLSASDTGEIYEFRKQFLLDMIQSLKICYDTKLPWCLTMEEDAVFPPNFIDQLEKFVIAPMEKERDEISVISLYAYYNQVWSGPRRLVLPEYSRGMYEQERARTKKEREALGLPDPPENFKVSEFDYPYGTVALLYPRHAVEKLIPYLEKFVEGEKFDADVLINSKGKFPKYMGFKRRHVQPSLINHIGFYSRRMKDVTDRGIFSQLNTDVRFQVAAADDKDL